MELKKADTRKTTSLLKKYLKENFGIKTSIRSEYFSMGSSIAVTYNLGPDVKEVSRVVNSLQYGNFNGMIDMYEHDENHTGLVIDGYQLNDYKYAHTNQKISDAFMYKLAKMFSDSIKFSDVPELKSFEDYHSTFPERWGSAWTWGDMMWQMFNIRNFVTNNEEEIELVSCQAIDDNLNEGVCFTYKVAGVEYNTAKFESPKAAKKSKKVAKKAVKAPVTKSVVVEGVELVDYSERAVAVFGNTKAIKAELKNIGGRFNYYLTNPTTKEKQPGWVFSKAKKDEVLELINN